MSTAIMMEPIVEASPRFKANIVVALVLLAIVTGGLALFGGGGSSFAADIIATAGHLALTVLLYHLFKLVNRSLSLGAAFFSLMGCAIGALGYVLQFARLGVLKVAQYLSLFGVEWLQTAAQMLLKLRAQAFSHSLICFGIYCLLIGYLIFRSTFLPRILGVLMAVAGLGFLAFLSAPLADYLAPYILVPAILGEGSLTLWLLVIGVNAERSKHQARV